MLDTHAAPEATCDDDTTHTAMTHTAPEPEPVFIVNPKAALPDVMEFVDCSRGAIAEMLDSAVLHEGMSGRTAYLLEQVFHIREAALSRLLHS